MIQDFLLSWELFHNTYLTGWLIGLLLSLVGVLVVARDQIFLSAAVAQASTLGIAAGLWTGSAIAVPPLAWLHSDAFLSLMAVAFAIIASLIAARNSKAGQESAEAITGWVFLISASGAILLLSHSPHGLEEIHRLLSSSLIGATQTDLWVFTGLLILTVLGLTVYHRPILLLVLDPTMARALGMRITPWLMMLAAWLGLTAGLSLRVSGMLYTFGCLVLPALAAKNVCREVRAMFIAAPLLALGTAVVGYVLANYYDYPPAQLTVVLLCLLVAAAWVWRRLVGR